MVHAAGAYRLPRRSSWTALILIHPMNVNERFYILLFCYHSPGTLEIELRLA